MDELEAKQPKARKEKIEEWEIEDAYRSLARAEEVKKNLKLMEKVREYAKQQGDAAQKIAGFGDKPKAKSIKDLKELSNKMSMED